MKRLIRARGSVEHEFGGTSRITPALVDRCRHVLLMKIARVPATVQRIAAITVPESTMSGGRDQLAIRS